MSCGNIRLQHRVHLTQNNLKGRKRKCLTDILASLYLGNMKNNKYVYVENRKIIQDNENKKL